jgi:hypothetical protein
MEETRMIIRGRQGPHLSRRKAMLAAGAGLASPGFARAQAGRGLGAWPERPVSLNTVHFVILIAATKSIRAVGSGVRGLSG